MVNQYLTPERALSGVSKASWQNQLVLWQGRVLSHQIVNGHDVIKLATSAGTVNVTFSRPARNLEYDRTGFRVAIKGYVRLNGQHFAALNGRSIILLEPPQEYSYHSWMDHQSPSLESYLAWRMGFHNPESSNEQNLATARALCEAAQKGQLDPLFLASLIQIESAWDVDAASSSGAQGLGQLMPRTAAGLGVTDAMDPLQNVHGMATMVANLFDQWKSSPNPRAAVLASYNAGPTKVRQLGGQVPDIPETVNYVYFIGYLYNDTQKQTQSLLKLDCAY